MICKSCGRKIISDEICCIRSLSREDIKIWDVTLFTFLSIAPVLFFVWKLEYDVVMRKLIFFGALVFVYQYLLALIYKFIRKNNIDYIAFNFYCHQKESRSFRFHQKVVPICSRCFGIMIGHFIIIITSINFVSVLIIMMFAIPLLLDGMIQYFCKYESNNTLRFFTGFMFSVPSSYFFIRILLEITNLFDIISL